MCAATHESRGGWPGNHALPSQRRRIYTLRAKGDFGDMGARRPVAGDDAASSARHMANSLAGLFGAGGALGLLSLVLPHSGDFDVLGVVVPCLLAEVGCAVLLIVGRRLPWWTFHVMVQIGTVLITVAVFSSGRDGSGVYATFYVWGPLFAFQFFSIRAAFVHLLAIAVAYT